MTTDQPGTPPDRRPLRSRSIPVFGALSRSLARAGVTPNAISVAGVVVALLGAAALLATNHVRDDARHLLWFCAAVCIQLRLLANMLDGMVAVDSGKQSSMGELYNELPDRVSDTAFLAATGYVAGGSVLLGWLAAALALHVAYLRALGAAAGAGQSFVGWMSKPQRMFTLTVLCLFQAFAPDDWLRARPAFGLGPAGLVLALISIGCAWTLVARWVDIRRRLEGGA